MYKAMASRSFITADTIEQVQAVPQQLPTPAPEANIEPALPNSNPDFPVNVLEALLAYKEACVGVSDFEDFMHLLQAAVTQLGLDITADYPKVAAVFNGYRLENGLKPL